MQNTASEKSASNQSRTGLGSMRYLRLFERLTPMIGCHDKEEICLKSCELVAEMLDVAACSILMANHRRSELSLMAATHIPREEWDSVRLPVDQGVCGQVFQSGQPLLVKSQAHFKKAFGRGSDTKYKAPSCVVVPVIIHDQVFGVINVSSPVGRRAFAQRDVEMIQAAGRVIAGALASAIEHSETIQIHRNLEDIFDSLLVGVLTVNTEGFVTHSNHRARKLFCLGDQHQIDLPLPQVLPGTLFNVCNRLMKQAELEEEPVQERLKTNMRQGTIMLEVTVSRMRCLSGGFSDRLLMFEDVGVDEEVRRLRESESMKRNFLSIISHELRTPLVVIRGAIPLIDPGLGGEIAIDTLRQVHQLLLKNCQRLSEVVDTVLDVTEIESGTLQLVLREVNVHELIEEVIHAQKFYAEQKKVAWECDFQVGLPTAMADVRRIRQVLGEMIHNAIKFSNPNRPIKITTRTAGPWIEMIVTNYGVVIGLEARQTIFEKFFQCQPSATRTVGGCGLGLFLVKGLMHLHGGQVELLASENEQTSFAIRLPLPAGEANVPDA